MICVSATKNILVFIYTPALRGSASEFAVMVLDHRNLGPQTNGFVRFSKGAEKI